MSFLIEPGSKVLFTGDSITDCDRRGASAPLGSGYVRMISDLIQAKYPVHNLSITNTGISGNTVRDLHNRWTEDVIAYQPDWLSIMIGINDIHRWLSKVEGQSVSPEEYSEIYPEILDRVKNETKAQLTIVDPFYISTDTGSGSFQGQVLEHLPSYHKTVKKMVERYDAVRVPLHQVFQSQLQYQPPERFAPEPVHPNPSGHLVMAYEWLKAMGW